MRTTYVVLAALAIVSGHLVLGNEVKEMPTDEAHDDLGEGVRVSAKTGWSSSGGVGIGGNEVMSFSTGGSFSLGGGERLGERSGDVTTSGDGDGDGDGGEFDDSLDTDAEEAKAVEKTEATSNKARTLLELGDLIENHESDSVTDQILGRNNIKCIDSTIAVKSVMGDTVPEGWDEKLIPMITEICDGIPAGSKPDCCPSRNQEEIDEVTQMIASATHNETKEALEVRLAELDGDPTCDANLCWQPMAEKKIGNNNYVAIQINGETNYFKGDVKAKVTKTNICIKTRNVLNPLQCERYKICDSLEYTIEKVCTSTDINDCGWKKPVYQATTSSSKVDISTDAWTQGISDKASVLTGMVCGSQ